MIVEVVSPNDLAGDVERKLREYREIGVPLIWIIYPETRTAHIYSIDGPSDYLLADQYLEGETVLPGFRIRLGDLFPAEIPALETPV